MSDLHNQIEEDKDYELTIGKSFQNGSKASYHLLKYDFTPAAIDKKQDARVEIGVKNDVLIEVPHLEGSTEKFTQFIGNKQASSTKDCILIFNTKTKTFTLERLESNFFLKRNRLVSSSKSLNPPPALPGRSITPTFDKNVNKKPKLETGSQVQSANTSATNLETSFNKKEPVVSDNQPKPKTFSNPNPITSQLNNDKIVKPTPIVKEPLQSNIPSKFLKKEESTASATPRLPTPPPPPQAADKISFFDDLNLSGSDSDSSDL